MLTGKTIYNRIDRIVERAYIGFLFDLTGSEFFTTEQQREIEGLGLIIGHRPLIELLYMLIRNRPEEGYAKDKTLNRLLDEVASTGILPVFSDTQQATLDEGKAALMQAVQVTKDELKKRVKQQILAANQEYKQEVATHRYTTIPVAQRRESKHTSHLLAGIAGLGVVLTKTFQRDFTTQLTNFINNSAVDRIADTTILGLPVATSETKVYKTVINDHRLCEWCHKFYTKNGKPRIYTLAELQANGSNYGKPKSQWRATIGPCHPKCRCQLHLLKDLT